LPTIDTQINERFLAAFHLLPPNATYILSAHSLGTVIMQRLAIILNVRQTNIEQIIILLFPAFEKFASTPNGKLWKRVIKMFDCCIAFQV